MPAQQPVRYISFADFYPFYVSEHSNRTSRQLQINAQNCVHCKTCDIKDPTQNIV